jgi:predicted nucleic acid-binding protein
VNRTLLVDTGPLVALFSSADAHHAWVKEAWRVRGELLTCDAVIAEAGFLLGKRKGAVDLLLQLIEERGLSIVGMGSEIPAIRQLVKRYVSVPMSFADGCLVRLSELHPRAVVSTCDTDFRVYRRNGRQVIPLLAPFS